MLTVKQHKADEYVPLCRNSAACRAGKRAWLDGWAFEDNPYDGGEKRIAWFVGWLDTYEENKLRHVFERRNK